jgi:putative component of membrane protein insertase Oxa1/YidC/SpoIIIJ protein YidD
MLQQLKGQKRVLICHPEQREGSAFSRESKKKADSSPRSKSERGSE